MNSDKILDAREERLNYIKEYLADFGVIQIKANIPGSNKNLNLSYILIKIFKNEVIRKVKTYQVIYKDSFDGAYFLVLVDKDKSIKIDLIEIEEKHELGRFIDLDLFVNKDKSITRNDLNKKTRKCYLCNDLVIKCMRSNKHTSLELIAFIDRSLRNYLSNWVNQTVEFSVLAELNLDYKFGLVSPSSFGSHPDMNYDLMKKAFIIIKPYLVKMFWIGFDEDDLNIIFKKSKQIGLDAESAMFNGLNNINAYKGLIFILGLILSSTGYSLSHNQNYLDIYENIKDMTKDIFKDINYNTFGEYAYKNLSFGGARKESQGGLRNVLLAEELLTDFSDKSLHMCLINIIGNCEDSVLLKRAASVDKYNYFKAKIKNINYYDLNLIKSITNECIENNISCGGSADILIAAVFMRLFKNKFI